MDENKKPTEDDWHRQGQEKYLMGVKLVFINYHPYRIGWDHDHCEFCGSKFSLNLGDLNEGYSREDRYRWICKECFNDFKIEFSWKVQKKITIINKTKDTDLVLLTCSKKSIT